MSRQRGGRKTEEGIFMGCRSSIQEYGGYPVHRSAKGREERMKEREVRLWMRNPEDLTFGSRALACCLRLWRHPLPVRWFHGGCERAPYAAATVVLNFSGAAEIYLRRYSPQLLRWERKNPWRNLMRRDCSAPRSLGKMCNTKCVCRRCTQLSGKGQIWNRIVMEMILHGDIFTWISLRGRSFSGRGNLFP